MAIQIRRGTESEWTQTSSNIVAGEPAITTDTGRLFVGTSTGVYSEFANVNKTLTYKGLLTSSDNVNNITDTGIYYIGGSTPTGVASTYTYSYLTVINNGSYITQELRKPVDGVLATREKSGSPLTWSDWSWYQPYVAGSSSNWTYKKWADGTLECWYRQSGISVSGFTSWGSLYYKKVSDSLAYPIAFVTNNPTRVVTVDDTSGALWAMCTTSDTPLTYTGVIYALSANNTSRTASVSIYAKGNWK